MDARDFRGIGRPAQEELRRRALFLIEHEGMTQAQAARAVGVHRQTVNVWQRRYRERGEDGLLDGRRVSPRRGRGRLTGEEARQVRGWIAEGTPDRLGLPFALWTSRAVRELVERRLGKRLGLSTAPLYLRRWGMTPQKPLTRARERSPAAVAAWLELDYPAIARRARAAKAVIYWGDETGISNQDQVGRSWAPRGQTPGGGADGEAGDTEPDRGGEQPRAGALHALRGRPERRPLPRLPAAADQGRRAEGGADRRQPEGPQGRQGPGLGGEPRPRDRAGLPAVLRSRPQPERVPQQRPEAGAAPEAAARQQGRADREHPLRAAYHPAVAGSRPGLLQARAGALRRLSCQVYPWKISKAAHSRSRLSAARASCFRSSTSGTGHAMR